MIYTNPLAKYSCAETGGLPKGVLWLQDFHSARALCADGTLRDLKAIKPDNVEYIAGKWRVQNDFPHKIIDVRGKPMVLGRKHDKVEFDAFHYYDGYLVGYNCYGPFVGLTPNCVVGRVDTATGSVWAYGANIPAVRAFLSVALFDRQRATVFAAEGVKISENSR